MEGFSNKVEPKQEGDLEHNEVLPTLEQSKRRNNVIKSVLTAATLFAAMPDNANAQSGRENPFTNPDIQKCLEEAGKDDIQKMEAALASVTSEYEGFKTISDESHTGMMEGDPKQYHEYRDTYETAFAKQREQQDDRSEIMQESMRLEYACQYATEEIDVLKEMMQMGETPEGVGDYTVEGLEQLQESMRQSIDDLRELTN